MKTITLSDHPGAKLLQLAQARHADYDSQARAYAKQIQLRSEHSAALRDSGRCALRRSRLIQWAGVQLQRLAHATSEQPAAPVIKAPLRQEAVWAAGERGEDLVCAKLARRLDDQ